MTTDELIDELRRAADRTSAPEPFDLGAVLTGGERRLRTRRRRRLAAGSGVTVACLAAAVAAGAHWLPGPAQVATPAATSTTTQPPETVEEELTQEAQATLEWLSPAMSILTEPQRPEDELPLRVSEHSRQKDPHTRYAGSTSRYLGQFEGMSFWVVISQDGLLCALESYADGVVGAVCDELSAGYTVDRNVFGGSTGPGVGREWLAWLVPDDYVLTPDETATWTFPSPNLAVAYVDEIQQTDPRWVGPPLDTP